MRVRRNQVEYASSENPSMTPDEERRDLTKAHDLLEEFAVTVIEQVLKP